MQMRRRIARGVIDYCSKVAIWLATRRVQSIVSAALVVPLSPLGWVFRTISRNWFIQTVA
jgi:hypothetical protein